MKKFGEVYKQSDEGEGNLIDIKELIDQSFVIDSFLLKEMTNYEGECALVNITLAGEPRHFRTSSGVLVEQLKNVEVELPIETTLRKVKNYFTFS